MLKNLNPDIFSDNSKFVYKMRVQEKKVPQFKKVEIKNFEHINNEIIKYVLFI